MADITTNLLQQLDSLPDALLDVSPQDLYQILPTPTLLHLKGKQNNTLFISVMLHGNETTGLLAVQSLLKKYQSKMLPRNVSIFFGNVQAAREGQRRLDGQADFNRIWPGTEYAANDETRMAQQIVDVMADHDLFASVDIHNNTGLNPHYGCINRLDPAYQQLATLFARFVVYFTSPKGVQSAAFAEICPAVTLECGRPDQTYGVKHAFDFIDSCLNLAELPKTPVHPQDIDLFHTVAQVKVKQDIRFSFDDIAVPLLLDRDLEKMNFFEVPAGTAIGRVDNITQLPVEARDEYGEDVSERFFELHNQELLFKRPTMPSMMTLNERVIKQDCLCYLMERLQG
ncbi:M14 family metallopeptidase [Methylophaga sp.]|uniref:M14 family metallopeptidase n=1 Tax=Methylophaga sp. TaxID=2024840 RepID=UPI003F69CEB8